MIDHRMESVPALDGSVFARCSPPPLCALTSSASSNSLHSSSTDSSSQHQTQTGKAHREQLTFPPFPSFAAAANQMVSPPFAPRLMSASSLTFQSSNPFVLPSLPSPSPSPTSSASSTSPSPSSSSSSSPFSSIHPTRSSTSLPYPSTASAVSLFGMSSSSYHPVMSRLYSGSSVSGSASSDTEAGGGDMMTDHDYTHSFSAADFNNQMPPSAVYEVSTAASAVSSAPHPLNRSTSSASVSSSLSMMSPRPRSTQRGAEREDAALSAAAHSDSSSGSLWHCSYGCGKVYRKSSGRSIRRHVVTCFKLHWPGGAELSESELSSLISMQQDRGLLVTGLKRWKMRQSRRPANELTESEKWRCPWNCGKFYRSTSSRSIQRHATTCPNRAAEQGNARAMDTKRVKRQRDEEEESDEEGDESSGSDGDDNDEAEETTDSSGSARSGNVRLRTTKLRSSHTRSSDSGKSGKPALRLNTRLPSSTSAPPTLAGSHHSSSQFRGAAASSSQGQDVDFLYPDSIADSNTASNQSASSASLPASPSQSYDALSHQKREVALQLQRLLRDIHSRHGTNHPVFQSPMMTQQLIDGLLNKDVDAAVDDMEANDKQQHSALYVSVAATDVSSGSGSSSSSGGGSSSSSSSNSNRRDSWGAATHVASLVSPSSASMSSGPPPPSLPSGALHWTCACGTSFKITSSKSIQKHRATCEVHQSTQHSTSHSAALKQQMQHEPRVKREKH